MTPNGDATVFGQFVILAGLVITAFTQISLAFINRRDTAARADALEKKVERTAADLALENTRERRNTEDVVRRSNDEAKADARRAYAEANNVTQRLSNVTEALNRRFDTLTDKKPDVDTKEERR